MHAGRNVQPLSYDMKLPDEAQANALRLLDASERRGQCAARLLVATA